MRRGLLYYLANWSGVDVFLRGCISSLCAANRDLQSSKVVTEEQVAGCEVHILLLENLVRSLEHDKGRSLFIWRATLTPSHYHQRIPAVLFYGDHLPCRSPPHARHCRCFFAASHLHINHSLVHILRAYQAACSSARSPGCDSDLVWVTLKVTNGITVVLIIKDAVCCKSNTGGQKS